MNETELQQKINADLRSMKIKFFHGEAGRGNRAKFQHRRGWPDLMIFKGNGNVFFVEVKIEKTKDRLTPDQEKFKEWCKQIGYDFYIVYNWRSWQAVKLFEQLV